VKRLLVIRLGALGDLVHLSAALDAVRQAHPGVELHLLTRPAYAQLATLMPSVTRAWFWKPHDGWPALFQQAEALRQAGFDGVVNLHPSFKTWLLTRLIHPTHAAVYRKEKFRFNGRQQRGIARRHAIEDFYRPFCQVLPLPENTSLTPSLRNPMDAAFMIHKPAHEVWIGLIPGVGGKRGNRAWPPEAWVAFLHQLYREESAARMRILLLGGVEEQALAAHLARLYESLLTADTGASENTKSPQSRAAPDLIIENHCGRWDIIGTARLMCQCDLIIGGDTGPLHLAAGLGVSVLGLFGPTSPARTGPRGSNPSQILIPPDGLDCWPCEKPTCSLSGYNHLACMREIPVSAVLAALRKKIGQKSP
jgi:ADP-heptose:LPS heptosyltransferase